VTFTFIKKTSILDAVVRESLIPCVKAEAVGEITK
jgi:hypothetical protein